MVGIVQKTKGWKSCKPLKLKTQESIAMGLSRRMPTSDIATTPELGVGLGLELGLELGLRQIIWLM